VSAGGISEAIAQVRAGRHLSREATRELFELIMTGEVEVQPLADFLRALAEKGETIGEIAGAADVMNEKATHVRCEADCIDTCGTGGDGISTFNVSTASAIIAAAAGACVAKHGSYSNTRVSGASEVIGALGVTINPPVAVLERCLRECRMAFLHAPYLHPAMRYAAPARRLLPIRTIFNLLGPLTNPAGAKRQLLGVSRPDLTETLGSVLAARGATLAWVVHGSSGLCDVSITGPTRVTEVRDGRLRTFTVAPDEVGLTQGNLSDLLVDSPTASAAAIRSILEGQPGPRRDHALLNAAAALIVAGVAEDLRDGLNLAAAAIHTGKARETLARLAACSAEKA
jgi:anthranilate phosphoribosyltransferase